MRPNQSCEMLSLFWQDSLLSHTSKVISLYSLVCLKNWLASRLNNCVSLSLLMVEINYGELSVCSGCYSDFTYIQLFIVKSIEKYFNHSITNGKTRARTIRLLPPIQQLKLPNHIMSNDSTYALVTVCRDFRAPPLLLSHSKEIKLEKGKSLLEDISNMEVTRN